MATTVTALNELRERRQALAKEADALLKAAIVEDRNLTAEEREKYHRIMSDIDGLTERINLLERHLDVQRETNESVIVTSRLDEPADEDAADGDDLAERAFEKWVRFGAQALEPEEARALRELRALGTGTGASGGYLVPKRIASAIETAMSRYNQILPYVTVLRTSSGEPFGIPTLDETSVKGELVAEGSATTQQDPTFGQKELKGYLFSSKLVPASLQLLQDSAIDLASYLGNILGQRVGRILNQYLTTGTGSNEPEGLQTGAPVGKQGATGQTTSVTYEDLVDLIASVDQAYHPNARWMFNANTWAAVKKLKDGNGRPLWVPDIATGSGTLLGFPYVINPDMPDMAASEKSIIFGDFKAAYTARLVNGIQLRRSEERYLEYFQVAFVAFQRADGAVVDTQAAKCYQNSAS